MADNQVSTRSTDRKKELFGCEFAEVPQYERRSKLPNGAYLIGRMLHLCKTVGKGQHQMSKDNASMIVAQEVMEDWISKNIYPNIDKTVAKHIKNDYDEFTKTTKYYHSDNKKTEKWLGKAQVFCDRLTLRAYDIRTRNKDHQKNMEEKYGVKMTEEDEKFYEDNCNGKYVATCTKTVPEKWKRTQIRKISRQLSADKKQKKEMEEKAMETAMKLDEEGQSDSSVASLPANIADETFEANIPVHSTPSSSRPTRSNPTTPSQYKESGNPQMFPAVSVRNSRKMLNENLVRCIVQCSADYKVSYNDLSGVIVRVANMVFGQNWTASGLAIENDDENTLSDSSNSSYYSDQGDAKVKSKSKRKRKSTKDLTNVFPSRRCVQMYLEDGQFLNLKLVAETLLEKDDNVVTVGIDDTTKAAGFKLYDIKSDHITVDGPQGKKILTTGFMENVSHAGEDSAKTYSNNLKVLALMSDTSVDELKAAIDFWITDRAADCEKFLEEMGVGTEKILKCCGHLILAVDNSCDKVFRATEQKIGVQNLLNVNAGDKAFLSSGSSIHTLGEIAIAKLLSPSHASHSVSLYSEFISWLEEQGYDRHGFQGFTANRFGRIAEIACQFLKMRDVMLQFFDAIVDTNSNKLVLAVSSYIQSDWFVLCCELYEKIGQLIIFPLLNLLGIDDKGKNLKDQRYWYGVRDFFGTKLPEMESLRDDLKNGNGKDQLLSALIAESIDALTRQLSKMPFFNEILGLPIPSDAELPDPSKLAYAPLSNLGCESEFAWFNNRVKVTGGTESVQSISRKNVISTNALLIDSAFESLSDEERHDQWRWARKSDATVAARKLQKDFTATLKLSKKLALAKKAQFKEKKNARLMKTVDLCKQHGGPLTTSSIGLLGTLTEKQLLQEVAYLRLTIAPDIRQQRRIRDPDTGRFKMERFTLPELRTSIKNALKPEGDITTDIDPLLRRVFS